MPAATHDPPISTGIFRPRALAHYIYAAAAAAFIYSIFVDISLSRAIRLATEKGGRFITNALGSAADGARRDRLHFSSPTHSR